LIDLFFIDKTDVWLSYPGAGDKSRKLSTTIVGRPVDNSVCLAEYLASRGFARVDQLLINLIERPEAA
jgi:hypothetical protein